VFPKLYIIHSSDDVTVHVRMKPRRWYLFTCLMRYIKYSRPCTGPQS